MREKPARLNAERNLRQANMYSKPRFSFELKSRKANNSPAYWPPHTILKLPGKRKDGW
jgi:hypothetical protein